MARNRIGLRGVDPAVLARANHTGDVPLANIDGLAAEQAAQDFEIEAAKAGAKVYDTTAAGIADTSNGDLFYVKGADADGYVARSLYKNVSGVATAQDRDDPSTKLFETLPNKALAKPGPNGEVAYIIGKGGRRIPIASGELAFNRTTGILNVGGSAVRIQQAVQSDGARLFIEGRGRVRHYLTERVARKTSESAVFASPDSKSRYWNSAQIAAAEALAVTEVQRRMGQDLSFVPAYAPGWSILIGEGQSYMAKDGTSGVYLDSARWAELSAELGLDMDAWTVGRDERGYGDGATFTPYTLDNPSPHLTMFEARERVVGPTNVDLIYSEADAAIGNFPSNARTGGRMALVALIFQWLWKRYTRATTIGTARPMLLLNKAKNEGALSDILGGDGLARHKHALTVALAAIAAHPTRSGIGARKLGSIMDHGEADEAAALATYDTDFLTAADDIHSATQTATSQGGREIWLMAQVASARGRAHMSVAMDQLALSTSFTGGAAAVFMHRIKSEIPTLLDTAMPVEADNDHPTGPGHVLEAIRDAIGLFYLHVLRQPYFTPYCINYWRTGNRGLAIVPNMAPPLRPVSLPYGSNLLRPDHLGFADALTAGGDIDTILDIRPVPESKYLVEILFANEREASGRELQMGGSNTATAQTGQVFMRDSFQCDQPIFYRFDERSRRWHNALFGAGGDTGEGYLEELGAAGLLRAGYVNQLPGFHNAPFDLGNPMARTRVSAETPPL